MPAEARAVLDELFARFHVDGVANRDWRADVEESVGPLGHAQFVVDVPFDGDRFADLCLTGSSPAALVGEERTEVVRRLHALLTGRYVVSVTTDVYWARLS